MPPTVVLVRPPNAHDFISTEDLLAKYAAWCSSCASRSALKIPTELWSSSALRKNLNEAMKALDAKPDMSGSRYAPNLGRLRGFKGVSGFAVEERGIGCKQELAMFVQGLGASSSGTRQTEQQAHAAAHEHTGLEAPLQADRDRAQELEAQAAQLEADRARAQEQLHAAREHAAELASSMEAERARVQELEAQLHAAREHAEQLEADGARAHAEVGQRALLMAAQRAELEATQAQVDMLTAQLEGMAVEHNQVLARELSDALEQQGRDLVAVLGGQVPGGARAEGVYDWMPAFIPDEDDWEAALPVFDEDDWEPAEEDQLPADQPLPQVAVAAAEQAEPPLEQAPACAYQPPADVAV